MEISTLPYPDVEDFRIAMPEQEMQRIRDSMEEENRKTMERVNRDLEAMRRDVMASLGRRDVHALRNDAKERSSAHVEAERIMRNMAALRPAA